MLTRLGNVIYWISCGMSAIALLFAGIHLFLLISPNETDEITIGEIQEEFGILPQTKWRKVGEGEIMVEGLGIVKIEGDVPNEVERRGILNFLREREARQAEKKQKSERQGSYFLLIVFTGIAAVSLLAGKGFRYVLAGK